MHLTETFAVKLSQVAVSDVSPKKGPSSYSLDWINKNNEFF